MIKVEQRADGTSGTSPAARVPVLVDGDCIIAVVEEHLAWLLPPGAP